MGCSTSRVRKLSKLTPFISSPAATMIWRLALALGVAHCALAASPFLVGINIDPHNPAGYPTAANLTDLGASAVRIEFKDTTFGSPTPSTQALQFYQGVRAAGRGAQAVGAAGGSHCNLCQLVEGPRTDGDGDGDGRGARGGGCGVCVNDPNQKCVGV